MSCKEKKCDDDNTFKCNYGACIDKDLKNNDIFECFDGSDEREIRIDPEMKIEISADNQKQCILQKIPQNGYVVKYTEGSKIEYEDEILYKCNDLYELVGNETNQCINGAWKDSSVPSCKKVYCDIKQITKHRDRIFTCKNKNKTKCEANIKSGTIYQTFCKQNYKSHEQNMTCQENGDWDDILPMCEPLCGNIKSGMEFPWHVAIFYIFNTTRKTRYVSAGTILTRKIIVSSSNVFWSKENEFISFNNFEAHSKDKIHKFKEMKSYNEWQYQSERANIIGFVVQNDIDFTDSVRPICFNMTSESDSVIVKNPGVMVHQNNTTLLTTIVLLKPIKPNQMNAENDNICVLDTGGGYFVKEDNLYNFDGIIKHVNIDPPKTCDFNVSVNLEHMSSYATFLNQLKEK